MTDNENIHEHLEKTVSEILEIFDIDTPPVPVELMLRRPQQGVWPEVDLAELSASFLDLSDRYSPRMSVVRLLARHVARCEWGQNHELGPILKDRDLVNRFARAIIMPREMLKEAVEKGQVPTLISTNFEVPEADVELRLADLNLD